MFANSGTVAAGYLSTVNTTPNSWIVAGATDAGKLTVFADYVGSYNAYVVAGLWQDYLYYYTSFPSEATLLNRAVTAGNGQGQNVPCYMGYAGPVGFDEDYIYCLNGGDLTRQILDFSADSTNIYGGTQLNSLTVGTQFAYVGDMLASGGSEVVRIATR
jgi:hypothetical protein